ncbi:hypothetical protein V6N12_023996 [Hibiscus sabdariffa]|uniref:Uncharacterized protein n=1 Tax=Hibiscus sabdariffa TaxID=183260 RepID=A0ABR2FZR0_9ROSI
MRHIRLLAEGGDDRNLSACWKLPCLAWDSIPTMDVNPCMEHVGLEQVVVCIRKTWGCDRYIYCKETKQERKAIRILVMMARFNGAKDRNKEGSELKVGESSSESTSDKPIFQAPEDSVQMKDTVDEVALMATCFRKEIYDENSNGKRVGSINLDENELVGGAFEETNNSRSNIGEKDIVITQKVVSALLDNGLDEVDRQIVTADKTGPKWADVVGCLGGAGQATGLQPVSDLVSSRAMKDIRSMGLTEVMVFNSNVE